MRTELIRGDCLKEMDAMPPGYADVIVTSPPYNIGTKYSKYNDRGSRADYKRFIRDVGAQMHKIIGPKGSLFLNLGSCPSDPLLPLEIASLTATGFVLQNTFHWIKSITIDHATAHFQGMKTELASISAGHFKPINSKRYVNDCHEYVFHFTHQGDVPIDRLALGVPYADKSNLKRWRHTGGQDKRCRGNVWFIPYDTIQKRDKDRPHPATFPVALAENCIRLHGGSKVRVMDPFLGIGTSALAAMNCGAADFIGVEIDPVYMREAKRRIDRKRKEVCDE